MSDYDDTWAAVVRAGSAHRRSMNSETIQEIQTEWETLFFELKAVAGAGPGDERVQALAKRWVDLIEKVNGPAVSLPAVMALGEQTVRDIEQRQPAVAESEWGRAMDLMIRASKHTH